ncbi:MAG: hypothetical protein J4F98_05890 [Acidobacteria bacterium]|nr:hypothetical protein [Acidobacteriota bacterium]
MAEEQILLVEGEDDEHVVEHLYRKVHGAEPPFEIVNKMGYSKLLKGLPLDLKRSGLRTLGILADANDDLETRWRELVAAAEEEDVRLPDEPSPSGTLVEGDIRVGVWLMPNNVSTGELEDFARELVPCADRVWPLAEKYIAGIPEADRKFSAGKTSKANLYAWLASRKHPQRIGAAIGAGDLEVGTPLAKQFTQWLNDLFGD